MQRWADATRHLRWDEADELWRELMEEWLKPPVVDQRYWNDLLDRRMAALERKEQRARDRRCRVGYQTRGCEPMNMPAKVSAPEGDVMESVIAKGDLAKLTPDERVRYYNAVCKSLGLNAADDSRCPTSP